MSKITTWWASAPFSRLAVCYFLSYHFNTPLRTLICLLWLYDVITVVVGLFLCFLVRSAGQLERASPVAAVGGATGSPHSHWLEGWSHSETKQTSCASVDQSGVARVFGEPHHLKLPLSLQRVCKKPHRLASVRVFTHLHLQQQALLLIFAHCLNFVSPLWRRGTMDLVCLVCLAMSIGALFASAERHSVYWNGSNPK